MFMKIDANSDGDVDWDEFTSWMLKTEVREFEERKTDEAGFEECH